MEKTNLGKMLKRLEEIANWFETCKEIDIEEGLDRLKEGTKIIKTVRKRIKEAENEFEEIKNELNDDNNISD